MLMETANTIFHTAIELGFTPFNLVLLVMVYFLGAHIGIFPRLWTEKKSKEADDNEKPATRAQMNKLANYYNHDTTAILTSIDEGIKQVKTAVENLDDRVKDLHNTHQEWEKYGIPTRDKK